MNRAVLVAQAARSATRYLPPPGAQKRMSFFLGLILFVVVAGIIDAKLPWPRPAQRPEPRP